MTKWEDATTTDRKDFAEKWTNHQAKMKEYEEYKAWKKIVDEDSCDLTEIWNELGIDCE
jgi:hypothetical protein